MIYNSFNFILIYPLLFLLYYVIPQQHGRWRNIYLLLVSYALYVHWSPAHALFLMGVTAVTYTGARMLESARSRKTVFIVSLLLALAPLAFFKYFHFVNETVAGLLAAVNIHLTVVGHHWAIPVGISFFTFQAIGYLADVYLKRMRISSIMPCSSLSSRPSFQDLSTRRRSSCRKSKTCGPGLTIPKRWRD